MNQPTPDSVKRHPVRGIIWGLVLGLGVALILIDRAVIALGTLSPFAVMAVFAVLGLVWGQFAPPKAPKSAADAEASQPSPTQGTNA